MLWSEFKALVEKELDGLDPEIEYIHISSILINHIDVYVDKDNNSFAIH